MVAVAIEGKLDCLPFAENAPSRSRLGFGAARRMTKFLERTQREKEGEAYGFESLLREGSGG